MDTAVRDLLRRVARIEPLDEPAGELGVMLRAESGPARACAPVLSVYLDMGVQETGGALRSAPGASR